MMKRKMVKVVLMVLATIAVVTMGIVAVVSKNRFLGIGAAITAVVGIVVVIFTIKRKRRRETQEIRGKMGLRVAFILGILFSLVGIFISVRYCIMEEPNMVVILMLVVSILLLLLSSILTIYLSKKGTETETQDRESAPMTQESISNTTVSAADAKRICDGLGMFK